MKKYISYIGILAVGLFLGWFFFGGSSNQKTEYNHSKTTEKSQRWSCSMHPQIIKSEPGNCPICGMDLILTDNSSEGLSADQFKLSDTAMALANIHTSIVGAHKSSENTITLSGKIVENKNKTATMSANFNGRIEKLYAKSVGQFIEKGQAIAQIYSPELIAAQQELITTYKSKEEQPQLYNSVRNKFKNWMINDAQLDAIEQTEKVKTRFTIYSHVSGVVTEILINEGSHIMIGKSILKVSNLNTVWAIFDVYENQIDDFKKGQEVTILTNMAKVFKAKVDFIDPILNPKTRTVKLRVVLINKKHTFKPGMFVKAKIKALTTNNEQVVSVPASAVLWSGKRSVVYLKPNSNQPVFEMREIILGTKSGDSYNVLKGLLVGDEIVTNGTFTVDAAAQLQGKKSMMNRGEEVAIMEQNEHQKTMSIPSNIYKQLKEKKEWKVSKYFQNQLKDVLVNYIKIKDALVQEDSITAKEQAVILLESLSRVDTELLQDTGAYALWMLFEKELIASASFIENTMGIAEQRTYFMPLSRTLSKVLQSFKINKKVYYQFCPMADYNKGAYWLSEERKIVNPYYGHAMYNCGDVVQEIE